MTKIKENTKMNDYTTEKMIEKLKANRGQGIFIADDETIQIQAWLCKRIVLC